MNLLEMYKKLLISEKKEFIRLITEEVNKSLAESFRNSISKIQIPKLVFDEPSKSFNLNPDGIVIHVQEDLSNIGEIKNLSSLERKEINNHLSQGWIYLDSYYDTSTKSIYVWLGLPRTK